MSIDARPPLLAARDAGSQHAAVLALGAGGVIGLPTETVYGLGVLPNPASLQALIDAKRRPLDKGIALLIDDIAQIEGLVVVPTVAQALAAAFWPGALTLVLPLNEGAEVPDAVTGGRTTLGIRVPDHPVPRALARALGPLAVSSANRSGEPDATTAAQLAERVGASLALILDDGPVRGGIASSVLAVSREGAIDILRPGALPSDDIERVVAGA